MEINPELLTLIQIHKENLKKRKSRDPEEVFMTFHAYRHISLKLWKFLKNNFEIEKEILSYEPMFKRMYITKRIHEYIENNNLLDNRYVVNCNEELQMLLEIPDNIKLTYLNLQTYIESHLKNNNDEIKNYIQTLIDKSKKRTIQIKSIKNLLENKLVKTNNEKFLFKFYIKDYLICKDCSFLSEDCDCYPYK